MARKKRSKHRISTVFNEKPENIDGLRRLKVGDTVLYKTNTLLDKCTVESIDKKDVTCKLSNGVIVSRGILEDGSILRLGHTDSDVSVKLWDEQCEIEFEYFKSKYFIKNFFEKLSKSTEKESVVAITKKLKRISEKYNI